MALQKDELRKDVEGNTISCPGCGSRALKKDVGIFNGKEEKKKKKGKGLVGKEKNKNQK